MRLGEILIKVGLLTEEQLARGLESQMRHGGRLGTNLVELGYITERQLAGTLSEQLGLPYVSATMVGHISPALIAKVPVAVAAKYRAFPITERAHVLYLCMDDPTNAEKVQTLAFQLSCSVQPCVATEITLNYALERYYGLRREPRFVALTSEIPPDAVVVHVAEDVTGSRREVRVSRAGLLATDSGEFSRNIVDNLPEITSALVDAKSDAEILDCIKRFFGAVFPQTVVLSLLGTSLVLVAETGLALDSRLLASASIPLREDSVVPAAIRDLNVCHHDTATDPTLRELCEKTGMDNRQLTIVPVMQSRGVRFLVVGSSIDMSGLAPHMPAIKRALNQISCALQIVYLRRRILDGATRTDGKGRVAV